MLAGPPELVRCEAAGVPIRGLDPTELERNILLVPAREPDPAGLVCGSSSVPARELDPTDLER